MDKWSVAYAQLAVTGHKSSKSFTTSNYLHISVIFVNENENGEKQFVNEN